MRVLRAGMSGTDVGTWANFLLGQGIFHDRVTDVFGEKLVEATRDFQKRADSKADGIVGVETYRAAMYLGFDPTEDGDADYQDVSWPPPPKNLKPPSDTERYAMFGQFKYTPAPTEQNPEGIRILEDWEAKNIVTIECPQLKTINPNGKVRLHKVAAAPFLELWSRWEDAGLLHLVLVWNGMFVPRFIRGSRTSLSNHSYGSAFDINATSNKLGARPAGIGEKGSVRELVPIANTLGWYWGGHYRKRPDGMHWELSRT